MRRGQVRSPPIVGVAANPGKRCRFCFLLSLWEADEQGGTTLWWFLAEGRGVGASSANPSGTFPSSRPPSARFFFCRAFAIGNDRSTSTPAVAFAQQRTLPAFPDLSLA